MATANLSAKKFAYFGLISGIIFAVLMILDVVFALQTSWNYTDNSISDLGTLGIADGAVPGFSTPGSDDPNYGESPFYELTRSLFTVLASVGGVGVAIYGIGVSVFERGHAKTGGRIFILTGTLMALVGAFNRLYANLHFYTAMIMCLTLMIGMAFVIYEEIKEKIYWPVITVVICAVFALICWVLQPLGIMPFGLAEIISFFVMILWLIIESVKVLKVPSCIDDGNTLVVAADTE